MLLQNMKKVRLKTGHEGQSLTLAADVGVRLTPRPGHFIPGKDTR